MTYSVEDGNSYAVDVTSTSYKATERFPLLKGAKKDVMAAGHALLQRLQAPPGPVVQSLEEQLMGCRTFKTQPIPFVNTTASLAVLDTYTPEQRRKAEAYTAAVSNCTDFACLKQANKLPRAPGQFHYPTFFVLGFPKCATTSLYCHLIQHPQMQNPQRKEPHTLSDDCDNSLQCPPEVQEEYVVNILNMEKAAASNFTKEGLWMAERLATTFPWLKLVISMRDPISQALAMHLHNLSHKRVVPCYEAAGQRIYPCIRDDLESSARSRYGPKIEAWMRSFPRDQLHLVQYESLIDRETQSADLQAVKNFLGANDTLPSNELPLTNWKHGRGKPDNLGNYWNMTRVEYEDLVTRARRNAMEVLTLLDTHGFADKQSRVDWLRRWEVVWRLNLMDNCEEGLLGNCKIVVS